ncbi:TPA: helix-turn-helix domain-containing protein [Salmonella enterica]|nr:helix-turn-helix domain-containing protein [Salmonella enterica]
MTLKEFMHNLKIGEAKKLAEHLGVSPSYLSQMASGKASISPTRSLQIEKATGGMVSREDTRPQDWFFIWTEYANHKYPDRFPSSGIPTLSLPVEKELNNDDHP